MFSYADRDMRGYFRDVKAQKEHDFFNLILPVLVNAGLDRHKMTDVFNANHLRIRWGVDWKDFTIHFNNPINDPIWKLDGDVHKLWSGQTVQNCLVVTCFLRNKGIGPVSSIAITDIYTLANGMRNYGKVHKVRNSFNCQTFMTLPFSHHSLSNNIYII